jgi:chromosomal replication initiator protein
VDGGVEKMSGREATGLVAGAEGLWNVCAEAVRAQVSEATWRTTFAALRAVDLTGDELLLAVPNPLIKERIEGRYHELVHTTIADVTGNPYTIDLQVAPSLDRTVEDTAAADDELFPEQPLAPSPHRLPAGGGPSAAAPPPPPERPISVLNPRYTFEAFVTGQGNRFAHAAALSVAETPAKSYNPLFIYGGAGLGKTHLLHAIGHYVRQNYPDLDVRYVSTETFTNEFIDAIRTNTATAFKRRYRECDVLLVDDIQFLENKEGTQDEFFHTFNSLHQANAQIVMTSDRSPKSIATLEDRLRSRFEWGLITDVQPPDLETRIAILRRKADADRFTVPDDVLEFIATHITDNIRELEGALIRVSAYAQLNQEPLTLELAEKVLSDLLMGREERQITPQVILEATAKAFGFTVDELCGKSRRRPLVTARQIGMYVFRELTDFSYPAIGREFGGRDHTTVIHAVEKVSTLMKERRNIYDQVSELTHRIKTGG